MRHLSVVAAIGLLSACATVEPIDCAQFPPFGPEASLGGRAMADRLELLALGRAYPSPDRVALAAGYASLEDYGTAFDMADLPGGSGSGEEAHLEIVIAAAGKGSLETALRAAEPISYRRNVARANLAIAVAQGAVGQEQAAQASFAAARDAGSNMVRQYAYYSLLSWELAQSGDFAGAIEQAGRINDSYWGYRAHAMVRIAWEQHKAGEDAAALETLQRARSAIGGADYPSPRFWTIADMQFLLAELFFHLGEYPTSMALLSEASEYFAGELYQAGDFDRVSAALLWEDLAEATGQPRADSRAEEFQQQAIQNLMIDNRTIGLPSLYHDFAKTELVRKLMEQGRSDWVYGTYESLDGDPRSSLGIAIAHAEVGRGNLERAISETTRIDGGPEQCLAYFLSFVELVAQDRGDDALRIIEQMDGIHCERLVPELPDGLHADLATNAAKLGDGAASCRALQAVEGGERWRAAVADMAGARASVGDYSGAGSIVRWAHGTGNIGGTQASEILARIAAVDPDTWDQTDVYPPVLGSTETFTDLQRWERREAVWFEDGIWDQ